MMPGPLALTSAEGLGFAILVVVLVGFFVGLAYVTRVRRRPGRPDIPPAMQPGPPDAELEKPRLEKLYGWALVSFLFLAIWIPITWLNEPTTNESQEATIHAEAVDRGAKSVELFSETNFFGVGCVRCHGDGLTGGHNLFNGAVIDVPPLVDVCGGPNTGHPLIHNIVDVRNTIMQGRPGTDMPSWSVRYAGGLDDQQIQDIVTYVVTLNADHVDFKENVCINPNAKGYVAPVVAAQ